MFDASIYQNRRNVLKKRFDSGILLFPGNEESPMNYPANPYPFRQDSTFLYYWGLDFPGLYAVIDIDSGEEMLFGYDFTVDDIIWMGPQETLAEKAARVGVTRSESLEAVDKIVGDAVQQGRVVHFLPCYRAETGFAIQRLTGIPYERINASASEELVRAVVAQRSIKEPEEIREIEIALDISYQMNEAAIRHSRPGLTEREVYGIVEGIVLSRGSHVSFPVIFSIHGETLHNHSHENVMKEGDILVLDSGAESPCRYASDITRSFPVSGKFTSFQKEVYNAVLSAQEESIAMMKPGLPFREVHLRAARVMADGLKAAGAMKGNMEDAVAAGAHALFFPHGLGHMLGLDVHDMEGLGEDYVGYDTKIKRSDQFGLAYLRMGKTMEPGHVLTVEPGLYFIPQLIDLWKGEKKFQEFICYDEVEKLRDFGGIRIEDDVLITESGSRVLGKPIPKKVDDVEALASS
jgi:Xaa-Pro aminopeptidase